MVLTEEFLDAVESGKKVRIRIMLKDMMLIDPTMEQFDEMLDYATSKIIDLYDEHDGESLKYDTTEWSETYLDSQMVEVVNNFSKERVHLLRNMVKYLYRDRAEKMKKDAEKKPEVGISRKKIGIGLTATGAAVTVAGLCASKGIAIAEGLVISQGLLMTGGLAVAAAGVILIATDKES